MTRKLLYVMRTALACAGLVSLLALSACHTADPDPEVLECLSDNDCPPACTCVDRVSVAACWLETTDTANDRIRCAGTCDAETECPEGTECRRETTEQPLPSTTVRFSCGPDPGTGGMGGMGGVGGTGGTAGSGGSGGAGGSGGGPCSTPLPTGTGFFVDVYATFDDTSPGAVSFADDGTLFVANVGLLGVPSPEQSLPILKIDAAATMIVDSTDKVNDPDVLIVDNVGVVASSGNVLVGGLLGVPVNGRSVGRLTELNASGTTVDTAESDPCIYNVSAMLLAQDNSLLLGNFVLADDPIDDDVPAVCKVTKDLGMGWVLAAEFIMPLIHPISGLAQAPRANNIDGDLFLSRTVQRKADGVLRKDEVDRYDSTGTLESGNLAEGIVLGYGPEGSEFDGVLILRSNGNLDLVNPVSSLGSTLLTGVEDDVGNSAAFYPNSGAAVLYISQWEQRRILRVSKGLLDATELGCSN